MTDWGEYPWQFLLVVQRQLKSHFNKTKYMAFIIKGGNQQHVFHRRTQLKQVKDFESTSSGSFLKDRFSIRQGKSLDCLQQTLPSVTSAVLNYPAFRACVKNILLYGSKTWTMKQYLQDQLDGIYTRLLMRVRNISRQDKTKAQIYGEIHPVSLTIAQRRARLAGHCYRAKDQVVYDIICSRLPCTKRAQHSDNIPTILNFETGDIPKVMI